MQTRRLLCLQTHGGRALPHYTPTDTVRPPGQVLGSTCCAAGTREEEEHHEVLDDVGLQLVQVGLLLPSLSQADLHREALRLFRRQARALKTDRVTVRVVICLGRRQYPQAVRLLYTRLTQNNLMLRNNLGFSR